MADKLTPNGSNPSRRRPAAATLANSLGTLREHVSRTRAVVHSAAQLLHESYQYEVDEADLGYCCDVIRDMLERVTKALQPLIPVSEVARRLGDPLSLAAAIELQRQVLFRAQAVARAVATLLRAHPVGPRDADLGPSFVSIDSTLEWVISEIEPLHLGLPIPRIEMRPKS
jgi:hypothetical protein